NEYAGPHWPGVGSYFELGASGVPEPDVVGGGGAVAVTGAPGAGAGDAAAAGSDAAGAGLTCGTGSERTAEGSLLLFGASTLA
ncbi:hypothetical protein, partial [Citrobacter freundii]|uniref:hypothetical protein n=1 Tax=Citrobacter freundii TaxID=546 RepID=UPI0019532AC5